MKTLKKTFPFFYKKKGSFMNEEIEVTKEEWNTLLKSAILIFGMLGFIICFAVQIDKLERPWLILGIIFIWFVVVCLILLMRKEKTEIRRNVGWKNCTNCTKFEKTGEHRGFAIGECTKYEREVMWGDVCDDFTDFTTG